MDEAMKILAEEEPDLKSVNFLRVEAEQLADVSMDYEVSANTKLLHSVEFMEIYSHVLFWQKFCESNVFTKKSLKSWFYEIFFRWE